MSEHENQALQLLSIAGFAPDSARAMLAALDRGGISLLDQRSGQFVCRWVNVAERAVPPDADTIIRTVSKTVGVRTNSSTHWLEGLRAPPPPADIV